MQKQDFKNGVIYQGDCLEVLDKVDKFDHVIQDLPYGYLKHRIETSIDYKTLFTKIRNNINSKGGIITFGRGDLFYEWNLFLRDIGFEHKEDCILYKNQAPNVMNNFLRYGEYFTIRGLNGFIINKVKIPIIDEDNVSDKQIASWNRRAFADGKHREELIEYLKTGIINYNQTKNYRENVTVGESKLQSREIISIRSLLEGKVLSNVLHSSRELLPNEWSHPTIKPTQSLIYLIKAIIKSDTDTILDPTIGSGSLPIAVIKHNLQNMTNIKFIGIELDNEYFDMACKRIELEESSNLW